MQCACIVLIAGADGLLFYFIRSGEVAVLKSTASGEGDRDHEKSIEIMRLGHGEYFGEVSVTQT